MNRQRNAEDVTPKGKRPSNNITLDYSPGDSKRLRLTSSPLGTGGEGPISSPWMDDIISPQFPPMMLERPIELRNPNWSGSPSGPSLLSTPEGVQPQTLPELGFQDFHVGEQFALPDEQSGTDIDMMGCDTPSSNSLAVATQVASAAETPLSSATPTPTPDPNFSVPLSSVELPMESVHSASPRNRISPPLVERDVCFGAITVDAISSARRPRGRDCSLTVSPYGGILKLSFRSSGNYAGIVNSEPLAQLLRDFSIQIAATFQFPDQNTNLPTAKKGITQAKLADSSLRIRVRLVISGLMSERDAVGELMSDSDLFFQHPLPIELSSLPYSNPHFLVRPGSRMPDLAQLSVTAGTPYVLSAETLDDVSKARLMRVFGLASHPIGCIDVKPSPRLKSPLKRHQLSALAMMTERECGIVDQGKFPALWEPSTRYSGDSCYRHRITWAKEDNPRPHYGGILADEMGLGKTLSVLALICWSLDAHPRDNSDAALERHRGTLIVTPKSTLPGWQEQIKRHIKRGKLTTTIFHGTNRAKYAEKIDKCDVVFTTYQTLRSDYSGGQCLYAKPWTRVVLDEAHHIRTRSTELFKAASALEAPHRWCLTGTPIHNSLDDYASLISFIGVEPFTAKSSFDSWISSPLKRDGQRNTGNLEILVKATCLRRTKEQLVDVDGGEHSGLHLPPRAEQIEWIELEARDREIYEFFKARAATVASGMEKDGKLVSKRERGQNIICLINFLRLICGHGESLLPASALKAWNSRNGESVDWQMMQTWTETDICRRCGSRLQTRDPSMEEDEESLANGDTVCTCSKEGGKTMGKSKSMGSIRPSKKVQALLKNLKKEQQCLSTDDEVNHDRKVTKSVVFSCWTKMLDLVQQAIKNEGFTVVRIDGQKSLKERTDAISRFETDPTCTVMLASIGSAGEGVDFTSATSVHLLEPHWNPMVESQAVNRVHRIGQDRPVTATRYITHDSVETYVQWIQKQKIQLINQSLSMGLDGEPTERIEDERWMKLQEFLGKRL